MNLLTVAILLLVVWAIGFFIVRPFCQRRLCVRMSDKRLKGDDKLDFGKGFLFGTATAAWQIEKDVHPSNWSLFEQKDKADGTKCAPPHLDACDGMNHFKEDLEIMSSINCQSYRFGLSWSAMNPEKGKFDKAYLQNYVSWCDQLKAKGIEPMVTLWHFEYPSWLAVEGGILAPQFSKYFEEFVVFVLEGLRGHCTWFYTINEPVVYSHAAYATGIFPPGDNDLKKFFRACAELMNCHAIAYRLIHQNIPDAQVSFAKHVLPFFPLHNWSIIESVFAYINNSFNTVVMDSIITGKIRFSFFGFTLYERIIEGLKDSIDFIGINHYYISWASIVPSDWDSRSFLNPPFSQNLKVNQKSDFGWSLCPESLSMVVRWFHKEWNPRNLPIIISEHGTSDKSDEKRQWFMLDSLAHLHEAKIQHKVPVIGYTHWSLLDNYEWAAGYQQRFGLVDVNFETQQRRPRPSSQLFKAIAARSK